MNNVTKFEFIVYGNDAIFTDPATKIGGERSTMHIPTYEAIKGVCESIYWKPTIKWVVDGVRVLNPIKTFAKATKPISINGKSTLGYNVYLKDVAYQVRAHFEFNKDRPDLKGDYNEYKHSNIMKRSLAVGGRYDIFLGGRECQGYVEPCKFGEGEGFYDNYGELSYGIMYHSLSYPNGEKTTLETLFWNAKMENGYIKYPKQKECTVIKETRDYAIDKDYIYEVNETIKSVDDEEGEYV